MKCAKLPQPNFADVFCPDCKMCLCQSCSDGMHEYAAHKTVPVEDRPAAPARCSTHDEKKNYYCETCKMAVCHACLEDEHKGHTYQVLSKIVAAYKAKLKQAVGDVEDWMKELTGIHSTTMDEQDKHVAVKGDNERSPLRKNIRESFAKAHARLYEMEKAMLEKVEEHEVKHKAALNEVLSEAGTALTVAHLAVERAQAACETDDITFMTNAQNILDLLSQALESTVHRVQVVQPPFECDMAKIETSCVLGDGAVKAEEVKSKAREMRLQAEEEERRKKAEEQAQAAAAQAQAKQVEEEARKRMMRWKPHPNATISGDGKIVTKTGANGYNCTVQTVVPLTIAADGVAEYSVRIVKGTYHMIGLATDAVKPTGQNYTSCGWYLDTNYGELYSGPPHKKQGNEAYANSCLVPGTLITVRFNYAKGELSFAINGIDKGVAYSGIPTDKPLYPTVEIYQQCDAFEFFDVK